MCLVYQDVQRDDTIVINGSPVCSISGDLEACPEDSKQYSGPVGMASYQWSVEGNASIDGADVNKR